MVVHHVIPDRLRDQIPRFCEVSPESRAKWDVLPPTSRQQRADTWCYEEDGTPSDEILVPNPNYTADSESELRLPRKRHKRKAADEEDLDFAAGQKKACRRETLESDTVAVDLCSPPTEPVQLPKLRDTQSITDRSLETDSQSIQSLEASLQTTLQTFSPLQGIDLHNDTPNTTSQLQQPSIPPDPSAFFEYTGNRNKPYVPGNLPSLHGTDAHLARSNNLSLLTSGFPFHGTPQSAVSASQPPDRPLVGPVAESLRLARGYYVQFDFQQSTLPGMGGAAEVYQRYRAQQQQQQQQMCGTQSRPPFIHPTPAKKSYPQCPIGFTAFQPPPPPPSQRRRRPQQQQQQQQQQLMHTGFPLNPRPSQPLHHDRTQGIQFLPLGTHLLSSVQSHPHPYPLLWQGVS
ncbi:hypothetical protein KC333_g7409 [Hortaea werneckii]|nr:hypothetical protein KC333_g7409 [Hortaea werneckii]KAI7318872.1 hypothetical protein KC326_g3388 [Hortaea werneckii]